MFEVQPEKYLLTNSLYYYYYNTLLLIILYNKINRSFYVFKIKISKIRFLINKVYLKFEKLKKSKILHFDCIISNL